MKRANSPVVRNALHEMRLLSAIIEAAGRPTVAGLFMAQIDRIQKAVDDDDFHDPRVVRQNAQGQWEDIPDAHSL